MRPRTSNPCGPHRPYRSRAEASARASWHFIDALCEVPGGAATGGVPLQLGAPLAHRAHAGEGQETDRMIPSVRLAQALFSVWLSIASRSCLVDGAACQECVVSWQVAEDMALSLDMALSVGRSFDRERQERIWQERLDAALVAGVAW